MTRDAVEDGEDAAIAGLVLRDEAAAKRNGLAMRHELDAVVEHRADTGFGHTHSPRNFPW